MILAVLIVAAAAAAPFTPVQTYSQSMPEQLAVGGNDSINKKNIKAGKMNWNSLLMDHSKKILDLYS